MNFEINISKELREEVFNQVHQINNTNLHNYANAMFRNAKDIEEEKIKAEASTVICDIISTIVDALEDAEMGRCLLDSYYGSEETIKIVVE